MTTARILDHPLQIIPRFRCFTIGKSWSASTVINEPNTAKLRLPALSKDVGRLYIEARSNLVERSFKTLDCR